MSDLDFDLDHLDLPLQSKTSNASSKLNWKKLTHRNLAMTTTSVVVVPARFNLRLC